MTVTTTPAPEARPHAITRSAVGASRAARRGICGTDLSDRSLIARIDEMISRSGIVTLSDADLARLRPSDRPGDAIRWLMSRGPAVLIVTHADTAATGYTRGGSVHARGHRGTITGSAEWEDAFAAGLREALTARGLPDRRTAGGLRSIGLDDLRGILQDANLHAAQAITPATAH